MNKNLFSGMCNLWVSGLSFGVFIYNISTLYGVILFIAFIANLFIAFYCFY